MGSDHAGYQMKEALQAGLKEEGYEVMDMGAYNEESVDYPDIAREVGEKVFENEGGVGILVCGTGTGMSIAANKMKGIRAASCTNEQLAEFARSHNNANVLCLGQRILGSEGEAKAIVKKFLETDFEGGRHERRVIKMEEMEG